MMDFSSLLGEPMLILENGAEIVNPEYILNGAVFLFTLIFFGNIILRTFYNKRR